MPKIIINIRQTVVYKLLKEISNIHVYNVQCTYSTYTPWGFHQPPMVLSYQITPFEKTHLWTSYCEARDHIDD